MIWLFTIISLVLIIGIAVYIEKKRENKFNEGDLTIDEKSQLDNDYIKKGEKNETEDSDKL
ncbi:hypothetical protein GH741_04115 [Aquibacillus halophilus]|uniref:Uncharacterized protein n=1 Tax=Aquibacillus halophilus TaxID=930132 RepID=A0A6A8DG66_9BACI|nr:hypothetical protein [Aquibacillus halophilus]MRH41857.1 hypothetical protein [Aquibacillus halophilus]